MTATIDLEDIRSYRTQRRSRTHLAASNNPFPRITVDFALSDDDDIYLIPSPPMKWEYLTPEEEIELGLSKLLLTTNFIDCLRLAEFQWKGIRQFCLMSRVSFLRRTKSLFLV